MNENRNLVMDVSGNVRRMGSLSLAATCLASGSAPADKRQVEAAILDLLDTIEMLARITEGQVDELEQKVA